MILTATQNHLLFPILSDEAVKARLDPDNPTCPFHESKYVGNRAAVDEILDLAYSAFQTRLRHAETNELFCPRCCPKRLALLGPPSVGKTTFAKIFGQEVLRLPFCSVVPEQITSAACLFKLLVAAYEKRGIEIVQEGEGKYVLPPGVLFIDEVHLLAGKVQDAMLPLTEANDGMLTIDGAVVDCRNLCIIIGTTDKGKLRSAFKTRFRHLHLKPYTVAEIGKIVRISHGDWMESDCLAVARLKPIPREAKDFADSVVHCINRRQISVQDAIKLVAKREGIHEGGINMNALKTLNLLAAASEGLSRASLCNALSIEPEEFENDVMPCLVANDLHPAYVTISNRHNITEDGRKYLEVKRD